jgi:hypothetical protein
VFGIVVLAVWMWLWYRATKPVELPIAKPYTRAQIRVITDAGACGGAFGGMLRAYEDAGPPGHGISILAPLRARRRNYRNHVFWGWTADLWRSFPEANRLRN